LSAGDDLTDVFAWREDGHITGDNFRDFTFANAVRLWGTQNPKFFEGTRVAKEAAAVLAAAQTPTLAAAEITPTSSAALRRRCPNCNRHCDPRA
jgi:hypothetical protein